MRDRFVEESLEGQRKRRRERERKVEGAVVESVLRGKTLGVERNTK